MRKIAVASGVLAVLVAVAVLAPRIVARQRPDLLTLEGLGSSIGVSVRDVDADESRKGTTGVVVQNVRAGTPAARAGLRDGDIVVELDGERARSVQQFTRLVRETAPGRAVKVIVVRGGSRQTLDITPEARGAVDIRLPGIATRIERDFALPPDGPFDLFRGPFSQQRLGVTVTALSDQLAAYFGVKQGALVSEVQSGSSAETAGLKAGDVITTINGQAVSTPEDVVRGIRNPEPGSSVEVRVTRDRREVTLRAKLPEPAKPGLVGGRPV